MSPFILAGLHVALIGIYVTRVGIHVNLSPPHVVLSKAEEPPPAHSGTYARVTSPLSPGGQAFL